MREKEFNPTYVLYDLILRKAIGYYGITEVDQLDEDVDDYLSKHPGYRPGDLSIAFDKWGLTIPEIGVPDIKL